MGTGAVTKQKTLFHLNRLSEINSHRMLKYEKAIAQNEDEDLLSIFTNMAAHSKSFKSDLNKATLLLGGSPTEVENTFGKYYNTEMVPKEVLTDESKEKLLSYYMSGEEIILNAYKDILNNEDNGLSNDFRRLMEIQKQELEFDLTRLKELKESITKK